LSTWNGYDNQRVSFQRCILEVKADGPRNTNQTFAAYKSKAAAAKANVPAALMKGGVMGSIPAANAVPPPV